MVDIHTAACNLTVTACVQTGTYCPLSVPSMIVGREGIW